MIKKIKNELLLFTLLLIILAVLQHSDLLISPMDRINLMLDKENFSHPLLWTSILYFILGFIRLIIKYLFYLKNRNRS